MTRVAYTDLIIHYTLSATTVPSSTNATAIITLLYQQAYEIFYGLSSYSADESTDTETIINTTEFKTIIITTASRILNEWSLLLSQPLRNAPMPVFGFDKNEYNRVSEICLHAREILGNPRLYGEATDDQ